MAGNLFVRRIELITFKKNVFFVEGATHSCLYDLNHRKLFRMPNNDAHQALSVVNKMDKSGLALIDALFYHQLLVKSDVLNKGEFETKVDMANISFAWIEITNMCNLKCIHCYDEFGCQKNQKMSNAQFEYVVNELNHFGVKKVQLIGGEPLLLGKELEQMIILAAEVFEYVEIFTNTTLLTPEWITFLAKYKIRVATSIYSYVASEHDRVTQQAGSFKRSAEAIDLLNRQGITYRVANVRIKGVGLGERNSSLFDLDASSDVVRMCGRANKHLLSREGLQKKLITQKTFQKPLNPGLILRNLRGHNCFHRRIYISSDLTVYPCVMERRLSHGNLKGRKLQEIIDPDILGLNKAMISECKHCEFRYCCHDCRPDSMCGSALDKPWYCTYDVKTGNWKDVDSYIDTILGDMISDKVNNTLV